MLPSCNVLILSIIPPRLSLRTEGDLVSTRPPSGRAGLRLEIEQATNSCYCKEPPERLKHCVLGRDRPQENMTSPLAAPGFPGAKESAAAPVSEADIVSQLEQPNSQMQSLI